jgi:ketosteroid isomerase-like protein
MINDPAVTATIAALHEEYEMALVSNDVEKLMHFFWGSPLALRFGVNESLYGSEEIEAFRKNRPAVDLERRISNLQIVALGTDTAIVTLEFDRNVQGVPRHGRQSQVWRKFDQGWKIVSAHVSLVPLSYIDEASAVVGLPITAEYREGVRQNIERAGIIAKPLLAFEMDEMTEGAPVFVP